MKKISCESGFEPESPGLCVAQAGYPVTMRNTLRDID